MDSLARNKQLNIRKWIYCFIGNSMLLVFFFANAGSPVPGEDLYQKRCALCHELPDPAHVPPEGWEKRMDAMAPLARLKKKQKAEVLQYLQDHIKQETIEAITMSDKVLVEEKCSTCHSLGRVALENFDGEAGEHVLERMQDYAGSEFISDEEIKRVLYYLQNEKNIAEIVPPVDGDSPDDIFRVRCSACHTLERVIKLISDEKTSDESWVHIISRMQSKAPDWISPAESEALLYYIQSLEMEKVAP